MSLTKGEREQFQRDGYVVGNGVFDNAAMEPIRRAITSVIDREAVELQAAGKLSSVFREAPFETRLAEMAAASTEAMAVIGTALVGKMGGGFRGAEMFEMLTHPPLLA